MSTNSKNKTSQIVIEVETNENNLPMDIKWSASDAGIQNNNSKAFFLSVWDPKEENTMRIDLWTKDMNVDEMRHFVCQSMMLLADTYERSTNDKAHAEAVRGFTKELAKRVGVLEE